MNDQDQHPEADQAVEQAHDPQRAVDDPRVPEDAGEYAEVLASMLARIPDRWGRWIDCRAGWYPLLAEMDAELRAIDPGYLLFQVKEKGAALRVYAQPGPMPSPACCQAFDAAHPAPEGDADPEARQLWQRRLHDHLASAEHAAQQDAIYEPWMEHANTRANRMAAVIARYEKKSVSVCEVCGHQGTPDAPRGWYRTGCPRCHPNSGRTEPASGR